MFYRLHKYCPIVLGANRGAIYDLQTGKVFSINKGAVRFLQKCENTTIENLLDATAEHNKPYLKFLDQISAMSLGSIYLDTPPETPDEPPPAEHPQQLEFVWLEITSRCNNKCLHCYATSGPTVDNDCVPHDRWLSLIAEARREGATVLQLIGGEPLLYPRWRELVVKAHSEGYELIEIFTNGTLIDDSAVKFFQTYNVNIATTIYADNAATHDLVTNHKGSFAKTMNAIKKLQAAEIPLRIASIIMKANEHETENIIKLCTELEAYTAPPDVVRPTGRGDDHELLPVSYTRPPIKPPFFTDPESFVKAQKYHTCLAGRLAITTCGDIIPCIFARSQLCGNILNSSLKDVLNGEALQKCWQTTKDYVAKCKDCEYRYACTDCRPHAQGSDPNKQWLACSKECSYNPYSGKWLDEPSEKKPCASPPSQGKPSSICPYGKKKPQSNSTPEPSSTDD
jgi:radical SAM protein with 4Fe4S-binding SPASM domain